MSNKQLSLTSLVAAIPGALLAALAVMAFIKYAGGPSITWKALAGTVLLIGGTLALMPVGILVFGGPKTEKAPKKDAEAKPPEGAVEEGAVATASADDFVAEAEGQDEGGLEVGEESASSDPYAETMDQPPDEAGSDAFVVDDFEDESDKK